MRLHQTFCKVGDRNKCSLHQLFICLFPQMPPLINANDDADEEQRDEKKLDKIFLWWKFLREKSAGKGNWIFSKPFEPKFCAAASFQIERNIQEWTNAWMQRKERKDDWNRGAAPKKNKVNYVFFRFQTSAVCPSTRANHQFVEYRLLLIFISVGWVLITG